MAVDIPFAANATPPALINLQDSAFSIGTVDFSLEEAPDELSIPISQNLAVKDLIGGKRIIQALGTVWKPLKWEGYFFGANAQYRARVLSRMMAEASVQRLTYLSYALDVVIEDFVAVYQHQNQCKYEITVQVLADASGVVSQASTTSVDAQIQSAVVNASTQINNMDSDSATAVTPSFQSMNSALNLAGPAMQVTGSTLIATNTAIQFAIAAAQNLLTKPTSTSTKKSLLTVTQYLNNLQVIHKNFDANQDHNVISLNGGSLFDVASQYYGDPSLALAIQTQNGLFSPDLPSGSLSTIVLPPLTSSNG